ncbi:hypothetical protein SLEP1_g17628 [Rubroshorea leprosula]|uniref:Reverse transcriptase domain-containing protein n=1 Tax=Rubroshorea leprosula TaxID=152421 RepID=A0AAV5J3Z6_9ROSI|nr:hypothetical protein SLEP1_g17628 [Rubroshorea leprosula]
MLCCCCRRHMLYCYCCGSLLPNPSPLLLLKPSTLLLPDPSALLLLPKTFALLLLLLANPSAWLLSDPSTLLLLPLERSAAVVETICYCCQSHLILIMQSATNLANVKQSTLSRPSGKLIVERNKQSPVQLEVGAMKSVNLQSKTSIDTGDKEMMQKAAGGESSINHSPSLVTVDVLMNEKPRPFRFCNAWAKDENFLDLVREAWSVDIQGCPMFVVVQKLKLNALFDETLAAKEKELQRELTKLERANLFVIAQRAKVTWLKEMDSNSAYFHAKVNERQHRSVINSILNSEGAKEGVQAIDMNVIRRGRVLTTEELEELCRPFTAKEVETALFSIPSNKSPGPDGFTSGGKILKQINATNITIVPKVSCPNGVSDYRPIACCNVIYKVISKLLTQRINEVLSMLGQRGLRQGDPISPYLFVLVMEYLTRKLKELDMQEKFKYHSKCRVMQLTHLIFVDDIMLFCKADEESTVLMMQKFEEFARVSGLEVNRMKSQVFFSGVREGQKAALIQKLGFAEGQLLVRYLGLPLISKKLSPGACQPIIDKIHQRIGS